MKTILNPVEHQVKIKGSSFYGIVFPVQSGPAFNEHLLAIKKKYRNASHYGQAYRLKIPSFEEFSSDDGEPKGTTGLPMLNTLKSNQLLQTGSVVVRYFGGTKLGKQGLIEAYSATLQETIGLATIKDGMHAILFELIIPYEKKSTIDRFYTTVSVKQAHIEYGEQITEQVYCSIEDVDTFEDQLNAYAFQDVSFKKLEETFIIL
ncbi:MAG: YigZ family protein [Bacteroidota bacterium]